jgi:ATP-dependent Clp protease protease subunit
MERARAVDDDDDEETGKEIALLQGFAPNIERSLFEARRIFLYGEINQRVARDVTQRLVAMAAVSGDPITIFLNSQGGHVEAGDTIHDMIRFVTPKVRMIGTGWVASAGAHIFLAPPREDRFCLPNTRFMLHQPRGGVYGQAMDIGIEAQEIIKMRKRLNQIIARQTGQPLEKVEKDTDRNYWMGADAAVEYGIVGRVITNESEIGS